MFHATERRCAVLRKAASLPVRIPHVVAVSAIRCRLLLAPLEEEVRRRVENRPHLLQVGAVERILPVRAHHGALERAVGDLPQERISLGRRAPRTERHWIERGVVNAVRDVGAAVEKFAGVLVEAPTAAVDSRQQFLGIAYRLRQVGDQRVGHGIRYFAAVRGETPVVGAHVVVVHVEVVVPLRIVRRYPDAIKTGRKLARTHARAEQIDLTAVEPVEIRIARRDTAAAPPFLPPCVVGALELCEFIPCKAARWIGRDDKRKRHVGAYLRPCHHVPVALYREVLKLRAEHAQSGGGVRRPAARIASREQVDRGAAHVERFLRRLHFDREGFPLVVRRQVDGPVVVGVGNACQDKQVLRGCHVGFDLHASLAEPALGAERGRWQVERVGGLDAVHPRSDGEVREGNRANMVVGLAAREVAAAPDVAASEDEVLVVSVAAVDRAERAVAEERARRKVGAARRTRLRALPRRVEIRRIRELRGQGNRRSRNRERNCCNSFPHVRISLSTEFHHSGRALARARRAISSQLSLLLQKSSAWHCVA